MDTIEKLLGRLTTSGETLSTQELIEIEGELHKADTELERLNSLKLTLGRVKDYATHKAALINGGMSAEAATAKIREYAAHDDRFLQYVKNMLTENISQRDYMFGYPANMSEDSAVIKRVKDYEKQLYLMNNCGDPAARGNYKMDSKEVEKRVVELFAHKLGLNDSFWGYITSGGTEGNHRGIKQGFSYFAHGGKARGVLYFSKTAHYSVAKYARIYPAGQASEDVGECVQVFKHQEIEANADHTINVDALIAAAQKNWDSHREPAVIVLTAGTTAYGATDDISAISKGLRERGIDFYIHLDAAMLGGIPNNQTGAPILRNPFNDGADSVSISLHKYLGMSLVNGVFIASTAPKRYAIYGNKPLEIKNQRIDYIGQEDSTILGSRSFMPYSTYQKCVEMLERSNERDFICNIELFERELRARGVPFTRGANTFVIDKPSERVCKKYQLAVFADGGAERAHVIIFPSHKEEIIKELAKDITERSE